MSKIAQTINIEQHIYLIRGHKVMLDSDLAALYGVTTKRLNQQVSRNSERFPSKYMFQLSQEETNNLKSQFATSSSMRLQFATASKRNVRYRPYVFTEHGAIMLAAVLNSRIAIQASLAVVDAFVRLREILATHKDLAKKLEELEDKYDEQFKVVFDAIRELMEKPVERLPPPPKIRGFRV